MVKSRRKKTSKNICHQLTDGQFDNEQTSHSSQFNTRPLGCIDTFVEYLMFCSRYFQCCVRHQVCAFNSRKSNRTLLLWKCNCTLQKLTNVTKRLNLTKKEVITTNDLILLCNIYISIFGKCGIYAQFFFLGEIFTL